ncbi:MAG: SUKH-3 domain-containing protein [Flavobacterium sp.]
MSHLFNMKFRAEVQSQFEKAGWFPGRNVKEKFDCLDGFEKFPQFAKDFLYEYGDLQIETLSKNVLGILNTKPEYLGNIQGYLLKPRSYGFVFTFPLGDYDLDCATMECDSEGRVYMSSDGPNLMAENFIEGIERVILEDYSDVFWWDAEKQKWSQEDMF